MSLQPITNSAKSVLRDTARRTRMRTVRAALITVLVVAGIAYAVDGEIAAEGALLGGIAGTLGFWALSLRLEQIALVRPERLPLVVTAWTFYRILIYAVFLWMAYLLDREDAHGLIAAAVGLLSTRVAITLVGVRQARSAQAGAGPPP